MFATTLICRRDCNHRIIAASVNKVSLYLGQYPEPPDPKSLRFHF